MKRCLELKLKYKAKRLGVIFDSTTHVCEAFAIVIQFVIVTHGVLSKG